MKKYLFLIGMFFLMDFIYPQSTITFDSQGWNANQLIGKTFQAAGCPITSNKVLATNYGFNLNVNNVSIYDLLIGQDSISVQTVSQIDLKGLDIYQVSETITDSILIEGWNGKIKSYSKVFTNLSKWQTLQLNYNGITRFVFKSANTTNKIFDYNIDNIVFSATPLPVELISFTSSVSRHTVILKWRTATEVNNHGFDIERSSSAPPISGKTYTKVGSILGHGTSNISHDYSYQENPNRSSCYYRLKQIDNNGNFKYSGLIFVVIYVANKQALK